ncbi:hypothetical protein SLEP1_g24232 [Rubroshorea leprosula]|uniref:Uncharacterized protein n=1 Tax=Rubroshorea leprosula TaxID=152421 RepID=A0AAV5JPH1_9ROSI|nr:hypothetical protein SLEP1_g24232 [Rubroshorea leprosula]
MEPNPGFRRTQAWVQRNPGVGSKNPTHLGSLNPGKARQGRGRKKKGHCWVQFNPGAEFVWCWVCLLEEEDDGKFVMIAKALLKKALQAKVRLPVDRDIPVMGFIIKETTAV